MSRNPAELLQRICFRVTPVKSVGSIWRTFYLSARGARIGSGTKIPPCIVNWPHQLQIGRNCVLEENIKFTFSDSWKPGPSIRVGDRVFLGTLCEFNISGGILVGDDALIASGCKFIDHNHGVEPGKPMNQQPNVTAPIRIGQDAWLGVNVTVLKGVTIGSGAIIGAGAVVTKSVPPLEIWAGIPARKIGSRESIDRSYSIPPVAMVR